MKLHILGIGTALFLFSFSPTAAADHPDLPPVVQTRVDRIREICRMQTAASLRAIDAVDRTPRFFAREPDGTMREVSRVEFASLTMRACIISISVDDPVLGPYLRSNTPVTHETPL